MIAERLLRRLIYFLLVPSCFVGMEACDLNIKSSTAAKPVVTTPAGSTSLVVGPVTTGRWFFSLTEAPPVSWSLSSGSLGNVNRFEYSVGSSAGASDVLAWTPGTQSLKARPAGLTLTSGQTYYINVRALDLSGTLSAVSSTSWKAFDVGSQVFPARTDLALTASGGNGPRSVKVADLNADGYPELVVTGNNLQINIFPGQSGGTFGSRIDLAVSTAGNEAVVGDFDLDGKTDVGAVCFNNPTGVNLFSQTGNLTFGPKVSYTHNNNATSIDIGLLDGDAYPDLAIADFSAQAIGIYLNKGSANPGVFNTETFASLTADTTTDKFTPKSMKLVDLRGSGKLDVVVTNEFDTGAHAHQFAVLLGNGNGTFSAPAYYTVVGGGALKQVVVVDLDGDGKLDVAIANFTGNSIEWFKGNGDGTFGAQATLADPAGSPYGITAADLNGDGKPDLVVGNAGSSTTAIYLNNGDGTFQPRVTLTTASIVYRLTTADINNDGKLDIVVTQKAADSVGVFMAQ